MVEVGQSDQIMSDMEACLKQRCGVEFLHAEKIAPTDVHECLLNISGDETVDLSTVRWWVVCFSSGDSGSGLSQLVQIVVNLACRLLFIAAENAYSVVVTVHNIQFKIAFCS